MNKLVLIVVIELFVVMAICLYTLAHDKANRITYGKIVDKQYSVIVEGKTESGKVSQEMIYLNKDQFDYTEIGDYVDLKKVRK